MTGNAIETSTARQFGAVFRISWDRRPMQLNGEQLVSLLKQIDQVLDMLCRCGMRVWTWPDRPLLTNTPQPLWFQLCTNTGQWWRNPPEDRGSHWL